MFEKPSRELDNAVSTALTGDMEASTLAISPAYDMQPAMAVSVAIVLACRKIQTEIDR